MGTIKNPSWSLSIAILFVFSLFAATTQAGTYDSTGMGSGLYSDPMTWTLTGGMPSSSGTPEDQDEANILNGHIVTANGPIDVQILNVHTNGNLTLAGALLEANQITVLSGGTIQGIDNTGQDATVYIVNSGAGFALLNEGMIRGGNNGGSVIISTADGGDLPCANNGSSVTGINGQFLGGDPFGVIYIVSQTIHMTNTQIVGGSGYLPNRSSSPVYIGGVNVTLDGNSFVTSGSNPAPGGSGGSVKIVASNCYSGLGTLNIGPNVNITVGTPIVAACPGVLLYAGLSSTISGTVGPMGAVNCAYWDPTALALAGNASIQAVDLEVAGGSLAVAGLNPGVIALEAQDNLTISVDTLDMTGLSVGSPYFMAGQQIVINAANILLDSGVTLDQLMQPAPIVQGPKRVPFLSVTPGIHTPVRIGSNPALPIQLVSVGNADIDTLDMLITDSQGWLSAGSYTFMGPLPIGQSKNYLPVINVPMGTPIGSQTELNVVTSINGGPPSVVTTVFTVVDF